MEREERDLTPESELRFEVGELQSVTVQLLEGYAEIFGVEMAQQKEYSFVDQNFSIFTWYGCKIGISGSYKTIYDSTDTNMISIVNTHAQLEARRDVALANNESGPRVLVVGASDSGKSTTARILCSYATRLDRTPVFVDIDVGLNSLTIPGCIAASRISKSTLSIEDEFSTSTPIVHFFGHTDLSDNIDIYKRLLVRLSSSINDRVKYDATCNSSGIILSSGGWVDGPAAEKLILQTIDTFSIDIVLVMGNDKLFSSLKTALASSENITIVKLPKSGGCVTRSTADRRRLRKRSIHEYFYGRKVNAGAPPQYSPARIDLRAGTFRILKPGGLKLSEHLMPIGHTAPVDSSQLVLVPVSLDLKNSILAVLHEDSSQHDNVQDLSQLPLELIDANIAGFLYVVEVDVDLGSITVLSPCPGIIPGTTLITGSIKWTE